MKSIHDFDITPWNPAATNRANLNALIQAGNDHSEKRWLYVPQGVYQLDGPLDFCARPMRLVGVGGSQHDLGSCFFQHDPAATTFTFLDRTIVDGLTFDGGQTAIRLGTMATLRFQSAVERCAFNAQTGVALDVLNQAWFNIRENVFNRGTGTGIHIACPSVPDVDQGTIAGNMIFLGVGGHACIRWQSGGGLRILDNKLLPWHGGYGIVLDPDANSSTSIITIALNSIESGGGLGASGIVMDSKHGSELLYVHVVDNQISGFRVAQVEINSSLIQDVVMSGNIFSDNTVEGDFRIIVALNGVKTARIDGNIFRGDGMGWTRGIYLGEQVEDVAIGANTFKYIAPENRVIGNVPPPD